MRWVLRLGVLVAVAVVGYQVRLRHAELAALSGDFDDQEQRLQRAETDIDAVDREVADSGAALRALDAHITAIERDHPDGIPPDEYPAYQRLIQERNAAAQDYNAAVERHAALRRDYERGVGRYNAGVEQANALAARSTPGSIARELWDDLIDSVAGE